LALHGHSGRIGDQRGWRLLRFRRQEEVLTILGPYATTGFEYRGIVRRDRSTTREFTDKGVRVAPLQRGEDGRILAALAPDHGYRCGERDKHYSRDAQELLRGE
jgi:hypothetical protein